MYTHTICFPPKPSEMYQEDSKMMEGIRLLVGVFSLKIRVHLINMTDIFGYEGTA